MTEGDPFDLARFIAAQNFVYERALGELRAGEKRSHWMWFVFPQLRALGRSDRALRYGIGSPAEARAYLAHPVLGSRLAECTDAVLAVHGRSLHAIFGTPDDMKFRSSMTLFASAGGGDRFRNALDRYYGGEEDPMTVALLAAEGG